MFVLFSADPLNERGVDPAFEEEARAAQACGATIAVVSDDNTLRRLPTEPDEALYRGWMMSPARYTGMESALRARGHALAVPSAAYQAGRELPRWYGALEGRTPSSLWFPGPDFDLPGVAAKVGSVFGDAAIMLKDYVKSRKHEWEEACFIPRASDAAQVLRVTRNFLRLQEQAEGGLVFREFVPLRIVGHHPKSGMPLANEWRLFFWKGSVFYSAPHNVPDAPPDVAAFATLGAAIPSPFFAMDVAETQDGRWVVIEVNDGGTAGVPEGGRIDAFWQALVAAAHLNPG